MKISEMFLRKECFLCSDIFKWKPDSNELWSYTKSVWNKSWI